MIDCIQSFFISVKNVLKQWYKIKLLMCMCLVNIIKFSKMSKIFIVPYDPNKIYYNLEKCFNYY